MPAVRTPRAPAERLASLKNPQNNRVGRPAQRKPAARNTCPNASCKTPDIQELDGNRVCLSCGTILSDSNVVSEVGFGETAAGAAVVQGGFVGEGQRFAKSMGSAFKRTGGGDSREQTEFNGRDEIRKLAGALRILQHVEDQAFALYKLAVANNFIRGRRIRQVAAVCLYIACRRDKGNTVLLMDFSEVIEVNVFALGEVYKALMKTLWLGTPANSGITPFVAPEPLIMKFARKLEFGSSTQRVAEDAAKIMRRMNRDWMVTGRRPAGLCGACIILAARMNNFRRTVREVVYVVKVADITISKRLEEFKMTTSSKLSVEQFRKYSGRLKVQHDPPAVYQAKMREEEKKRKLAQLEGGGEVDLTQDDASQVSSRASSREPSATPQPRPEPRRDADGFVIPELPIDPALITASKLARSKRQRDPSTGPSTENPRPRKKAKTGPEPPITIDEADLLVEEELEDEIDHILANPEAINNAEEAVHVAREARAKALADSLRGTTVVPDSHDIADSEFDNDPEVRNCLLSATEIAIKERIWVTHNEDWLRAQQAKILKQQLEEAEGGPPKKRSYKKKNHGRMGDGTVLEGGTPVASPADASAKMINKRAKGFSNRINYAKLSEIYSGEVAEETRSQASAPSRASRAGTAAAATRSPSAAPSASPAPSQGVEAATVEASKGADGAGLATPPATQTQQSQQGKGAEEPTVISEDEEDDDDEDDVESEINEDEEAEHAIEEIGYG
ncbi:hypothetical protein LTR04_001398, partial [Oleoguttula sp. CCFEE 6159]